MKIITDYIKSALSASSGKLALFVLLIMTFEHAYGSEIACRKPYMPLISAALQGEVEIVKQLISEGVDINEQLKQPRRIFSHYQSRYVPGPTALMLAAWHGYDEIVDLLVNEGPNFNKVSSCNVGKPLTPYCEIPDYYNALMLAAEKGHCKIIGKLIHAGASPYSTSTFDDVIFDCLNNLIDTGDYNYNHQAFYGESLLMMALYKGQKSFAEALIKKGVSLDLQSDDGYTALMIASLVGNTRIVRLLIKAGANINIMAKNGETAASIAFKRKNSYCLEQLMLNGAYLEINEMAELKSLLDMKINVNANIGKNFNFILGEGLPLSSDFGVAVITGDINTVKKNAQSYFGYWGSCCTADKECALMLAALTDQTEVLNYLCSVWDVPIYPSSEQKPLTMVLDWLCFLEPTNLSQYLKW